MLIYTISMWDHGDLDITVATVDRNEALKQFESSTTLSLQVWEKGEVLIEMISNEGEYFADGGLERYPEKGQLLFNEIVEQLQ
ncbi:hypothetical protein EC917_101339 [Bacillus thuringiensis]|uniref:Uncharacterized protein n=1 Tax=Bacillus thuringiensis TaxID=1428 RepID=A0A4R4BLQ4_BACTU|nr:hypothetical protein [Bacillus thuringiensis]TCW59085.1 hypothetical protein EC917_101339 [Bacillus thuringiensis]TCW59675.1 hypothetical protein EC910_101305 [Bacillus thuringiensis]